MSRPARPRHAASLVLVRPGGGKHRVLMGRRAGGHRFMPDVYVFPGGGVHRGDARARATSELRPAVRERLEERAPASLARALGVAALRETWEETGLALGAVEGDNLAPDLARLDYIFRAITPTDSPMRFHARFFTAAATEASGTLRSNGELLDLSWFTLEEARRLPLIDVTSDVLDELERHLGGAPSRRVPLFHYRNGRRQLTR